MIQSPFVRWTIENRLTHMHGVQPVYFLLTTESQKVAGAISYRRQNDNVMYRPCRRFIDDYGEWLGLDGNLRWTSEDALGVWLDAVVHNSFVQTSTIGVGCSWYFALITDHHLTGLMPMPEGCTRYVQGHNRTIWMLLRHGSKSWPIRVVDNVMQYGWDEFCKMHRVENGYKIILSCERRWIFDTIIFDPNDNEIVYRWSEEPNAYWQHAQPLQDNPRTACLPSIFDHQSTLMKFGYTCETTMFNGKDVQYESLESLCHLKHFASRRRSPWKLEGEASVVSSKLKLLEQELLNLERIGKSDLSKVSSRMRKQTRRYQALAGKIDNLCRRMVDKIYLLTHLQKLRMRKFPSLKWKVHLSLGRYLRSERFTWKHYGHSFSVCLLDYGKASNSRSWCSSLLFCCYC